jgi:5S rRNA maturation endonuclease (ribonuclease M5)
MQKNDVSGVLIESLSVRGLTLETALDVGLGYDNISEHWVIPTVQYSTSTNQTYYKVIGFEYRPINFDKKDLRREKGSQTGLAMVSPYTDRTEVLVIVEGYFDGYALYQYLKEKNQLDYYHIVTCSNGVGTLSKQIAEADFSKYKKCYLFIDNDEVGRKAAEEIIELYPFMHNIVLPCGCKDFNEHYTKCIVNGGIKNDK